MEWFLIGVFIVSVIALSHYLDYRRQQAAKAMAAHLGFTYSGVIRQPFAHEVKQSDICSKGRNRHFSYVINGAVDEVAVAVGDYAYTVGHGKKRHTQRQTIACIESRHGYFPRFVLKPENILHKLGGAFGYQDIDFESHPQFSKAYCLQGPDEAAIRECFTPSVLTFFQNHQGLHIESTGSTLMYYRPRYTLSPKRWPELINTLCRVQRQF